MKITRPILGITVLVAASSIAAVKFRGAIVDTWHHNPTANTAIMSLLVIGLIYALVCAIALWRGKRQWAELESTPAAWNGPVRLRGVMGLFKGRFDEALANPDPAVREEVITGFETMLHMRARMAEYMAGLLIGLGLLGTFLGLMETMGSIGGVLATLNGPGGADPGAMMEGLSKPLSGMSSAFSASLLGLLGSLLMGAVAQLMSDANDNLVQKLRAWSQQQAILLGAGSPADATGTPAWTASRGHETHFSADAAMLTALVSIQRSSAAQTALLENLVQALQGFEQTLDTAREQQVSTSRIIASGVGALDECRVSVSGAVTSLAHTLADLAGNGESQRSQLLAIELAVREGVTSSRVLETSLAIQRQSMLEAVRHISTMTSSVGRSEIDVAMGEAS